MLLAVDIGNTSISCGIFTFSDGKLLHSFKLSSDRERTADEYISSFCGMFYALGIEREALSGAIISSVVPMLTHKLCECAEKIVGSKPKIVGPGLKNGFSIKIDNPSELGADLVANTSAVISLMGKEPSAAIIIDMGTATTISALTDKKEYIGNCILPGIKVSLDSLHSETAQLPSVAPTEIQRAIGKSTPESVRSGVVLGNAIMIDGFVDKFENEMKLERGSARLYATGGLAPTVLGHISRSVVYDEDLTLKGLYCIYMLNQK